MSFVFLVVAIILNDGDAWAQHRPGDQRSPEVESWLAELEAIHGHLQAGNRPRVAERRSVRLYRKMLERIDRGEGGAELLARVLFYQAVAEARQGAWDSALWHWQVAQNLFPSFRRTELSVFSDVEERFRASVLDDERWQWHLAGPDPDRINPDESAGIVPPQRIKAVRPEYPLGSIMALRAGATTVEVIIRSDGKPQEPILFVSSGYPGMDAAAMLALKDWRWRVRPMDRSLVFVVNITVNFRLKGFSDK